MSFALRCPRCEGEIRVPASTSCPACGWSPDDWNLIDLMGTVPAGLELDIEDDFGWDFRADPRISPFTEERWQLLAAGAAGWIRGAGRPHVASVGGGGRNEVARMLDGALAGHAIVDPSLHQLGVRYCPAGAVNLAIRGIGERLPFMDATVDVVHMPGVLDHLADPPAAIAEAARVSVAGGLLVVTLTNDGSWYRALAGRFRVDSGDGHVHRHRFDVRSAEALLAPHYDIVTSETIGFARLPASMERRLARVAGPGARRRLIAWSDAAGRRLLGRHRGGMFLVVGRRR